SVYNAVFRCGGFQYNENAARGEDSVEFFNRLSVIREIAQSESYCDEIETIIFKREVHCIPLEEGNVNIVFNFSFCDLQHILAEIKACNTGSRGLLCKLDRPVPRAAAYIEHFVYLFQEPLLHGPVSSFCLLIQADDVVHMVVISLHTIEYSLYFFLFIP